MNAPRTDAACFDSFEHPLTHQNCEVVKADFCRQLERELIAEHEKVRELREALEKISRDVDNYFGPSKVGAAYPKFFDESMSQARAILEKTK